MFSPHPVGCKNLFGPRVKEASDNMPLMQNKVKPMLVGGFNPVEKY